MTSSTTAGSMPARRTASGSTAAASASDGTSASVPLNDRPIAVRTALTITGSTIVYS
jgi:hypothetical protein